MEVSARVLPSAPQMTMEANFEDLCNIMKDSVEWRQNEVFVANSVN